MQIKTIITAAGTNEIDFGDNNSQSTAHFYWFKNLGDSTLYISAQPNPVAGEDNIAELPAKGAASVETDEGKVYVLGAGKVEIHRTNSKFCPFELPSTGSDIGGIEEEISELKQDKVDKYEILNSGIKSFSYVPLFGGEFTVTTVDEEGYISPHSRASVTGRISKYYTYRITFNGEIYELPCSLYYFFDNMNNGKTVEYLGNLSLYTEDTSFSTHDIRNVPFCIISDLDENKSIDVFTQFPNMNSILVEQIQKEQIVFPKSLVWGDDYCPIEFKRHDGTYNGVSIGLNLLKSTRGTFAIGYGNKVYGDFSTALGVNCEISGAGSYTEGNKNTTSGNFSHAEGSQTTASGNRSHAEGSKTTASGNSSHAEGQKCIANGHMSHSGGNSSEANERASFAHGNFVKAIYPSQFVVGYGNDPQEDSIFEIGNGLDINGQPANTGNTEPATRQNAFRVTQSGVAVVKTGLQIGNTIINEEQLQKIIALIN